MQRLEKGRKIATAKLEEQQALLQPARLQSTGAAVPSTNSGDGRPGPKASSMRDQLLLPPLVKSNGAEVSDTAIRHAQELQVALLAGGAAAGKLHDQAHMEESAMRSQVAEPALGAYEDRACGAAARKDSARSASDWKWQCTMARGQHVGESPVARSQRSRCGG